MQVHRTEIAGKYVIRGTVTDFHTQFKELAKTVTQLCLEVAKATTQARADQGNIRRELDDLHSKTRNQ